MSKKVRIAVIGVGVLGSRHAEIYNSLPDVELVALCDHHTDRSEKLAAKLNTKSYARISDFVGQIDAASVCTPAQAHHEVAKELLQKGIHLLIEKPIATTVAHADEMLRLAEAKKLILQTGHVERFNAGVRTIQDMIKNPLFIECDRIGPYNPRIQDVGVVLDLMIHDIDIVLSLVDSKVASIDAIGHKIMSPTEDFANARIRFENGTVCNLTASRIARDHLRKIRVFQENVYITLDYFRQEALIMTKNGTQPEYRTMPISKSEPLREEIQGFVECVRTKQRPVVSGKEGRDALAVALQIVSQISQQHPIHA